MLFSGNKRLFKPKLLWFSPPLLPIYFYFPLYAGAHACLKGAPHEIVSRLQILIATQSVASGLSNVDEVEGIWMNFQWSQKGSVPHPSLWSHFSFLLWQNSINTLFRSHKFVGGNLFVQMSNSKTLQHSVSRFCNCAEAQVLYYVGRIQQAEDGRKNH